MSEPPLTSCVDCIDPDGEKCYPSYGVAPHLCFYKVPGATVGESLLLPKEQWPSNFIEDPDVPGCGVWFCPTCKEGLAEHQDTMKQLRSVVIKPQKKKQSIFRNLQSDK